MNSHLLTKLLSEEATLYQQLFTSSKFEKVLFLWWDCYETQEQIRQAGGKPQQEQVYNPLFTMVVLLTTHARKYPDLTDRGCITSDTDRQTVKVKIAANGTAMFHLYQIAGMVRLMLWFGELPNGHVPQWFRDHYKFGVNWEFAHDCHNSYCFMFSHITYRPRDQNTSKCNKHSYLAVVQESGELVMICEHEPFCILPLKYNYTTIDKKYIRYHHSAEVSKHVLECLNLVPISMYKRLKREGLEPPKITEDLKVPQGKLLRKLKCAAHEVSPCFHAQLFEHGNSKTPVCTFLPGAERISDGAYTPQCLGTKACVLVGANCSGIYVRLLYNVGGIGLEILLRKKDLHRGEQWPVVVKSKDVDGFMEAYHTKMRLEIIPGLSTSEKQSKAKSVLKKLDVVIQWALYTHDQVTYPSHKGTAINNNNNDSDIDMSETD